MNNNPKQTVPTLRVVQIIRPGTVHSSPVLRPARQQLIIRPLTPRMIRPLTPRIIRPQVIHRLTPRVIRPLTSQITDQPHAEIKAPEVKAQEVKAPEVKAPEVKAPEKADEKSTVNVKEAALLKPEPPADHVETAAEILNAQAYWKQEATHDEYPEATDVTELFLAILGKEENWSALNDSKTRKITVYQNVAMELESCGYRADPNPTIAGKMVENKWNNLKKKYKSYKDSIIQTGGAPKKEPKYYALMDALLGDKHDIIPQECLDSGIDGDGNNDGYDNPDDDDDNDDQPSCSVSGGASTKRSMHKSIKSSCRPTPPKRKFEKAMLTELQLCRQQTAESNKELINSQKQLLNAFKEEKAEARKVSERVANTFETLVAFVTKKPANE